MKGFERIDWKKTKNGIILTTKDGKKWQIDLPYKEKNVDYKHYGNRTTSERIALFILCVGKGMNFKEAEKYTYNIKGEKLQNEILKLIVK